MTGPVTSDPNLNADSAKLDPSSDSIVDMPNEGVFPANITDDSVGVSRAMNGLSIKGQSTPPEAKPTDKVSFKLSGGNCVFQVCIITGLYSVLCSRCV